MDTCVLEDEKTSGPVVKSRSGMDHPLLQLMFFTIIFYIPFYRWRHLSEKYSILNVDWLLVLGLFGIIGPYILVRRRLPRRLNSNLNLLFLLFFLVNVISSLMSPFGSAGLVGLNKIIFGYVLFALSLMLIGPKGYQRTFPVVFSISITLGALLGIIGFFFQVDMLTYGDMAGISETGKRGVGASSDANNSALLYIFSVPFLVHWLHYGRNLISKCWAGIQLSIVLFGMICTYSRGGFLILVVICSLLLFEERRRFHPRLLGPVLAVACGMMILAVVAVPDAFIERIMTLSKGTHADRAMSRRASYLKVGLQSFLERPLLGSGTDTFKYNWFYSETSRYYDNTMRYAHNTYIEVIVGSGIVGLVLFLSILFRAFCNFTIAAARHRAKGEECLASLATSYKISFLCICGYLMILSAIEHKLFLLALAFSQLSLRMASTDQKVFSEDSLLFDVDEESWTGKDAPSRSTILLPDAEQNAHHKSTI